MSHFRQNGVISRQGSDGSPVQSIQAVCVFNSDSTSSVGLVKRDLDNAMYSASSARRDGKVPPRVLVLVVSG